MKKILTNYRYYVLFVLVTVAMFGIFSVPVDDLPFVQWLYTLVSSKVIGFGAVYIIAKLGTIPELMDAVNNY